MPDPGLLEDAVKYAAGGGGAAVGGIGIIAALRWFITFMTGRIDREKDRIDAAALAIDLKWKAYREVLERQNAEIAADLAALRVEVERCHAEKLDLAVRLARLERGG